MLAIDPAAFGHSGFNDRIAALAVAVERQSGARLPGARRVASRARAAQVGIAISPEIRAFGAV
jgi:(2R)-3-sulfolactate dehydrogenase (NADP+)